MKDIKVPLTLAFKKSLSQALEKKSLELSYKEGKRVTRSEVVERALAKFGVKPK